MRLVELVFFILGFCGVVGVGDIGLRFFVGVLEFGGVLGWFGRVGWSCF